MAIMVEGPTAIPPRADQLAFPHIDWGFFMMRFSASLLAGATLVLTIALPASAAVENRHIEYFTCDGSAWSASMSGDQFYHTPRRGGPGHPDVIIRYSTWDSHCWEARWNSKLRVFEHRPANGGPMHRDVILNYLNWRHEKLTARRSYDDYFFIVSGPH
jgi:hypothetical protein